MEHKRILVIGANGQLAKCLSDVLYGSGHEFHFASRDALDVTRASSLQLIGQYQPEAIINTAAFHDLRACEEDFDTAFRVNAMGVANILAAMPMECHLYHLSTDYVFGGDVRVPWHMESLGSGGFVMEDGVASAPMHQAFTVRHQTNPLNSYGRTKRAGELIALDSGRATVIRTASLFSKYGSSGKGGSNFLLGMLERACEPVQPVGTWWDAGEPNGPCQPGWKSEDMIRVDSDVVMSPTYAPWLARAILELVAREAKPPIAHIVCDGPPVSWFDFAKAIFEIGGFDDALKRLVPKQADAWPPRPHFSALQNSLAAYQLGTWQDALKEFFAKEWPRIKEART